MTGDPVPTRGPLTTWANRTNYWYNPYPPRPMATRRSSLGSLFPSMAMARLVVFFAIHPGEEFHLRELKRRLRLSTASLQHELARLTGIGALKRENRGNRAIYAAAESHPAWRAWMLLLRAAAAPGDVLREVLVDAPGIDAAFVFGSFARGDAAPDSDLDLLLLGSPDARRSAGRSLVEAELLLGRPIDVLGYDPEDFALRVRSENPFVRRVLAGPVQWVHGGPQTLHSLQAA